MSTNTPIVVAILAGGNGTRLWPLSTKEKPKQLLSLDNKHTLLENTIRRTSLLTQDWHIVVNESQRHLFTSFPLLLVEPTSKNTAAAILLSALHWLDTHPDAIFCSFPADHVIHDTEKWHTVLTNAITYATDNNEPVLLGIKPTYPASCYGYVVVDEIKHQSHYMINQFIEKPSSEIAAHLLHTKKAFWNSGILISPLARLIDGFKKFHPMLYEAVKNYKTTGNIPTYTALPSISVDIALLEQGYCSTLFEFEGDWSDIGNYETFYAAQKTPLHPLSINAHANTVISNKQTILIDVHDLHIIETEQVLVVMHKKSHHSLPEIIKTLHLNGLSHLV